MDVALRSASDLIFYANLSASEQPTLILTNLRISLVRDFSGELSFLKQNGAGDRIRTYDRLITNQLLYRLSYASFDWKTLQLD